MNDNGTYSEILAELDVLQLLNEPGACELSQTQLEETLGSEFFSSSNISIPTCSSYNSDGDKRRRIDAPSEDSSNCNCSKSGGTLITQPSANVSLPILEVRGISPTDTSQVVNFNGTLINDDFVSSGVLRIHNKQNYVAEGLSLVLDLITQAQKCSFKLSNGDLSGEDQNGDYGIQCERIFNSYKQFSKFKAVFSISELQSIDLIKKEFPSVYFEKNRWKYRLIYGNDTTASERPARKTGIKIDVNTMEIEVYRPMIDVMISNSVYGSMVLRSMEDSRKKELQKLNAPPAKPKKRPNKRKISCEETKDSAEDVPRFNIDKIRSSLANQFSEEEITMLYDVVLSHNRNKGRTINRSNPDNQ